MKSKKQSKKAANSRKASLKSRSMGKVKSLRLASNHNETFLRSE